MTTHVSILSALEPMYAAVVCDVLDSLGYPQHALPHNLRPLTPAIQLIGRAFTARAAAESEVPAEPYKLEIEAGGILPWRHLLR